MHFVLSGEEADMAEGKILMVDDDKEIADLVEIHLIPTQLNFNSIWNGTQHKSIVYYIL